MFTFKKKHNKLHSDDELIALYKESGNQYYVAVIFQRYIHLISAIALDYLSENDAEDAVMEVFEILSVELKKTTVKKFNAWLYSVSKNHCLKKKRSKWNSKVVNLTPVHQLVDNDEYESILKEERFKEINALNGALNTLKSEQRLCLEMFYWEHKSYKEIENDTGIDIKKIKSHIQNGKRNLKQKLEA